MSQSPSAAAIPMFAAAGMVVTEIRTPISAPDFAVERLSMPAAPAQAAMMKANTPGFAMISESPCEPLSKPAGIRSAASNASVASTVTPIASGKPTASASAERAASSPRRWTSATHRPATGPNSGPTTIAPTTRIGESRKIPIEAMIAASTM